MSAVGHAEEPLASAITEDQQTRAYFTFRNGESHARTLTDVEGTAMAEGDIIFGPSSEFFNTIDKRRTKALSNESYGKTWPNGLVPYQLNSNLSGNAIEKIRLAVDHWNSVGSITLVERTADNASAYPDYIDFVDENRCASWIGYRQSGKQSIYTGDNCSAGSMIHEIGHALGLLHEHTRPDRDNFVKVHWDRIETKMQLNFEVIGGSETFGPYDFGSIMHYGPTFFSIDGKPTIEPLQATTETMGQRIATSQRDKDAISTLYQSDLSLVTSSDTSATSGGTTEVTFYVTNNSSTGANTLQVQIPLPEGSTLQSYRSAQWACAQYQDTAEVICESPVLSAGADSTGSIQLSVPQPAGQMLLDATLTSRTPDKNTGDNSDSTSIAIITSPNDVPVIAAAKQGASAGGGGAHGMLTLLLSFPLLALSRRRHRPVLVSGN